MSKLKYYSNGKLFSENISKFNNPNINNIDNTKVSSVLPRFDAKFVNIKNKNIIDKEIEEGIEKLDDNYKEINELQKQRITKDRNSVVVLNQWKKSNSIININYNDKIIPKKNIKTIKFGLCIAITSIICKKSKKIKDVDKIYPFLKKYINKRLDVTFYLRTLEKFDRVRVLLFNYYQNQSLNFTKIPNLSNNDELLNIDIDLQNKKVNSSDIAEYFNFRIKNKEFDECDEQLLKIVTPEIQNLVMSENI